jgi:hypothetical protein
MENLANFLNVKQIKIKFQNADDFEFTLHAFTLSDDAQIDEMFPDKELLKNAFNIKDPSKIDVDVILRMFYLALNNDGKEYLAKFKTITRFDEYGKRIEKKDLSGPEKLKDIISGPSEFWEVYKAVITARNLADPLVQKVANKLGEDEKKRRGPKSTT